MFKISINYTIYLHDIRIVLEDQGFKVDVRGHSNKLHFKQSVLKKAPDSAF